MNTNKLRLGAIVSLLLLFLLPQTAISDPLTSVTCGGLGQKPCSVFRDGWWQGGLRADGCDRGLDRKLESKSSFPWFKFRCRLGTRLSFRVPREIQDTFAWHALAEQRKLARGEPLNWFTQIGTHNAFNVKEDGYAYPNQSYSISDQLNMGSRVLYLDVHNLANGNKLSHGQEQDEWLGLLCRGDVHCGASKKDRHMTMALREIREWLRKNPKEIIVIRFEADLRGCTEIPIAGPPYWWWFCDDDDDPDAIDEFKESVDRQLGDYVLGLEEYEAIIDPNDAYPDKYRWPTTEELLAIDKRVIVFGVDSDVFFSGFGKMRKVKNAIGDGGLVDKACPTVAWSTSAPPEPPEDDEEAYKAWEDQWDKWWPGGNFNYVPGVEEDSLRIGSFYDGGAKTGCICPGDNKCNKSDIGDVPCEYVTYVSDIRDCNVSTMSLDQFGGYIHTDGVTDPDPSSFNESEQVLTELVWSWRHNYRGWLEDNKAAVFNAADARWTAEPFGQEFRFACAHRRIGPPQDWIDWQDERGPATEWKITEQRGAWGQGRQTCAEEFGGDFDLSAPSNALQNQQLEDVVTGLGDQEPVWLAYHDIDPSSGVYWASVRENRGLIKSFPADPKEGDVVVLSTVWKPSDWLLKCFIPGSLDGEDQWTFGDGSAAERSGRLSMNSWGAIEVWSKHKYLDNHNAAAVSHTLPDYCLNLRRDDFVSIRNAVPELRLDCSDWSGCAEQESDLHHSAIAGELFTLGASFRDAGALDEHTALVNWGDESEDNLVVQDRVVTTAGVTGSLIGTHAYSSCESFEIEVAVTDDDGGRAVGYVPVEITDNAPTITCPISLVVEAMGPDGSPANLGEPATSGGECFGVDVTNDALPTYPIGTTTVTWAARDKEPTLELEATEPEIREATCTQEVTVVDTTPPVITAPPDVTVTANLEGEFIGQALATDAVGVRVISKDAPAMFKPGKTVVTWYAMDDAGNMSSDKQTVTANSKGGGANGMIELAILIMTLCLRFRRKLSVNSRLYQSEP